MPESQPDSGTRFDCSHVLFSRKFVVREMEEDTITDFLQNPSACLTEKKNEMLERYKAGFYRCKRI